MPTSVIGLYLLGCRLLLALPHSGTPTVIWISLGCFVEESHVYHGYYPGGDKQTAFFHHEHASSTISANQHTLAHPLQINPIAPFLCALEFDMDLISLLRNGAGTPFALL